MTWNDHRFVETFEASRAIEGGLRPISDVPVKLLIQTSYFRPDLNQSYI